MDETGVIESQAISFLFQVAFWLLTSVVASLIFYIWDQSKDVKKNKEEVIKVKEELTDKINGLDKKLAVNSEKDSHIDKQLEEIKAWMISIDKKIESLKSN